MTIQSFRILQAGLKQLYQYNPVELIKIFCLMLLQKMLSGIGLLLLLPLLQLMGGGDVKGSDTVSRLMSSLSDSVGIETDFISIISIFLVLLLLATAIDYIVEVRGARLRHHYTHYLRTKIYRQVLYSQWRYLRQKRSTEINHTLAIQIRSISNATHLILASIASTISLGVLIFLSFSVSWSMTLITLFAGALFVLCLWPYFRISQENGNKELVNYREIFNSLSDQLRFLKMIKSHQHEESFLSDIEKSSEKLENQSVIAISIQSRTKWVYKMGAALFFVIILSLSHFWLQIPLEQLILLLIIFSRILPQVSALNNGVQRLFRLVPVYDDIHRLQLECDHVQEKPDRGEEIKFNETITFNDISFRYPNSKTNVLTGLSFKLKKGQLCLVTGDSGMGKSTLVDILAGLLVPSDGEFSVDNTLITPENMLSWRRNICYVSQETYLLNDTLYRNLNPDNEPIEDDAIWNALRLAAADGFVNALPEKLQTLLGENGVSLSGGERQRIALARAIIRQAPLIILDEATSALDAQTEQKIHDSLLQLRGKATFVIISHRPGDKMLADIKLELQ
ncbi:ABC transporter ATP-binding protein [Terasakiella pusilla]|uniref:ABC transporter ATP-binding protein n=1 Tax=Terasakiella pusilla TaxID=64973 RepID=UPI003AA95AA2